MVYPFKKILLACSLVFLLFGCAPKQIHFSSGDCLGEIQNAGHLPDFSAVGDGKVKLNSKEACEFFCALKTAVESNKKLAVAQMVRYPFQARVNRKTVVINKPEEFSENYDEIISPYAKKAILNQAVLKLWASWQGVIVGQGEVWIGKDKDGQLKVTAILNWPNVSITR